jgi:hypothetical protein
MMGITLDPQDNLLIRIYEILGRPGILGEDGRKYLHITCLPLTQFGELQSRQLIQFLLQEQRSLLSSNRATFLETCRLNLDGYPVANFTSGRIEQWFDWLALENLEMQDVLCSRCHAALLELKPSIDDFASDGIWSGNDPITDCLEVLTPLSQCQTCGSHFSLEINLEKVGLIQKYLFDELPAPLQRVSGLVWQNPESMQGAFGDFASFLDEIAVAAAHPIVLFFYQSLTPYEGTYFKVLPLMGQAGGETELTRQLSALTSEVLSGYKELRDLHKSERRSQIGESRLDFTPGVFLRQKEGLISTLPPPVLNNGPWRSLLIYALLAWLAESTTRHDNVFQYKLPWADETGQDLSLEFSLTDVRRRGTTIFNENVDWDWRKIICLFAVDVHRSVGSESLRERWQWALNAQPSSAFTVSSFFESLENTRKNFLDLEKTPWEKTPTGDLMLRVFRDPNASNRIKFILDDWPLDIHDEDLGSRSLFKEEEAEIVADMNALAKERRTRFLEPDPTEPGVQRPTIDRLKSRGWELWTDIMPPEFQKVYVSSLRRKRHQTLLLVSDNASFPWELIRPNGQIGTATFDDPWMAVQFDFARWLLAHPPPAATIGLQRICCVATPSGVPGALEEVRHLEELVTGLGGTCDKPASKDQLLGWLGTKPYDVVHFACHGNFLSMDPGESIIRLPDGNSLSPGDLSGPTIHSMFSQSRPLVFMNSCHSGRTGSTLIGVGGWASKFIDQQCGAFIGCGWEVESQLASDFAIAFYDRLRNNKTLSDAVRIARARIKSDTNPTYLAYCLYGDPRCRRRN